MNAASLARAEPALYVIEVAHWIDEVSESMLADFFAVIPHTRSMVLITYRPGYEGALTRMHGAQTIALAPLSDPESSALVGELLGPVVGLGQTIIDRTAGNPFSPRRWWLLRLHALLAQVCGDDSAYRDYRDRYRAMATSLGFEGHMAWAEAMT